MSKKKKLKMGTEIRDDAEYKFGNDETIDEMDINFRNEKISKECFDSVQKIKIPGV
jgi:hypothetical protein